MLISPLLFGHDKGISSPLRFDSVSSDLGSIKESDGTVFHTFHFVNTSSRTLKFGRIAPSCSCINALFTADSYESGETGEIIIGFNPAGTMGKVYRYVDIYEFEGALLVSLSLTADVIPEVRSRDEQFRYRITDHVYATTDKINMGYITIGGHATQSLSVINTSSDTVALHLNPIEQSFHAVFDCPPSLAPGTTAMIGIDFSIPDSPDAYGIKKDIVEIWVDGARNSFTLSTSFIGIDHFNASCRETPDMVISPSMVALDKNMITRHFEGSFIILNRGNADLHIRSVETESSACANINNGKVIPPGQRKKIKAKSRAAQFSVFLVTNDPARPMREIQFNYND